MGKVLIGMSRPISCLCLAIMAITLPLYADPAFRMEGRVLPLRVLEVIPSVEGIVNKVNISDGSEVTKGDVLFELEDIQQRAQVESCKADLCIAQAEADQAERLYQRLNNLDTRGTTAVALEEAKNACEVSKCNKERAKALLQIAEDELSKMHIKASFDGRVAYVAATEGSLATTFREPLAKVVQMDPVRVAFEIPIEKRSQIYNADIKLMLSNEVKYEHCGKVDFEACETSEDGKTVIVGATFPNPKRDLLLGMKVALEVKQE